ncbi:MAG: cytochrome c biogenesis protein CcsA [Ignavibacteriales bacterium]|nr:cytochrome c biogenesis protein CcsA [Ignavibacteriales bacterium]
MNSTLKLALFFLMIFVIIAGIFFPVVKQPSDWYELQFIDGLGEKVKIIFFHVPLAWLSVIAFLGATVSSIKFLKSKNIENDFMALSFLQIGFVFTILTTLTGAIWARFSWGSFWNWDPRQTSILFLLIIYGALFALRSAIEDQEKRARFSSVYCIITFLMVPFFIFILPRLVSSLHPGSANDTSIGPIISFDIQNIMQVIYFLSLISFGLLFYWLWKLNYRSIFVKNKNLKGETWKD